MENSFELYPVRVCVAEEEDEYGACTYLEVVDIDGGNVKIKFNDSNDCEIVDRMINGLMQISCKLCEKAAWEEAECLRCPED